LEKGLWRLKTLDFRDFAGDKHRSVDDAPFGGGPGLIMRPDIAAAAIDQAFWELGNLGFDDESIESTPVIYMSPRGAPFTQMRAEQFATGPGAIILCGRFEGIDERVLEARKVEEICIADAVMTGGEAPAMAMLDATARLIPGVIGARASLVDESFSAGLLEHPQYTRPSVWEGREPPAVLKSGDHGRIAAWRKAEAERVTRMRRPDLWRAYVEHRGRLQDMCDRE
jgi:tRNA (guanine37-N1)-methyltransferase